MGNSASAVCGCCNPRSDCAPTISSSTDRSSVTHSMSSSSSSSVSMTVRTQSNTCFAHKTVTTVTSANDAANTARPTFTPRHDDPNILAVCMSVLSFDTKKRQKKKYKRQSNPTAKRHVHPRPQETNASKHHQTNTSNVRYSRLTCVTQDKCSFAPQDIAQNEASALFFICQLNTHQKQ